MRCAARSVPSQPSSPGASRRDRAGGGPGEERAGDRFCRRRVPAPYQSRAARRAQAVLQTGWYGHGRQLSGRNDGAACLVLMSAEAARARGAEPLATVRGFAVAGVDPRFMGIGPVPASRKALERAGLALPDMGLVEINEAFAAQTIACIRELGLDEQTVNVNGGAIALGHPLGAPAPASLPRSSTRCASGAPDTGWPPSASPAARAWPRSSRLSASRALLLRHAEDLPRFIRCGRLKVELLGDAHRSFDELGVARGENALRVVGVVSSPTRTAPPMIMPIVVMGS